MSTKVPALQALGRVGLRACNSCFELDSMKGNGIIYWIPNKVCIYK